MLSIVKFLFITAIFLIVGSNGLIGQVSINIGYTGSTFLNNKLRKPISAFNAALPDGAKPLKKLNYLNGLHVEVSSSDLDVNFGLEYNGTFASVAAKRLRSPDDVNYNYIFNYSLHAFGPVLTAKISDRLSIGSSGFYNLYAFKNLITLDDSRQTLSRGRGFSVKPFIDFLVSGEQDIVGASFRFFMNYPFYDADISSVYTALDPNNTSGGTPDDKQFKMSTFGISLILHNIP